jgi:uncharacterized membrane protein
MEDKETGRVEAFSDGVFAVAITLLVLTIQPLHTFPLDDVALLAVLLNQWSACLAFVVSFATIGIMWINHQRLFSHSARIDTTLLLLNLLLLLIVVLVPFPTAVLADAISSLGVHGAALFYSGTMVVLAIAFNPLWRYAARGQRLLSSDADREAVQAITAQYRFGPLLYLVA